MINIVTTRFIECHDFIKSNNMVKSSRQFALALEYAPQSLNFILKRNRDVPIDILRRAIEVFKFNPVFLFEGVGHYLKDKEAPVVPDISEKRSEISYVPYAAEAGYGDQLLDVEYVSELPSFTLPGDAYRYGTFRCFDVHGDSMEPSLYSGEKIICSKVEKSDWINNIRDNYVYVIVTCNSIVVKRIENKLTEGKLIAISDNTFYEKYEIHGEDIVEIWRVKEKISTFLSCPKNVRNGLHDEVDVLRKTIVQQSELIKELNKTMDTLLRRERMKNY